MFPFCLIGNSRYFLASGLELKDERRLAGGLGAHIGNHLDSPNAGSRELSFGDKLARSGDP